MAENVCRGFTSFTGGAVDALDSVNGNSILNGDLAIVKNGGKIHFYNANTVGGQAESSPNIIVPDTNPGSINWELQGISAYITMTEWIPIANAIDGTSGPDAIATFTSTNGKVQARTFDGASAEDVRIPWSVPADIYAADGVKFQVVGVITAATGPSSEGVVFGLSGYSMGHGDALNGTFGTEITSSKTAMTLSQYYMAITTQSAKVTITDLAASELAMLKLIRQATDASDTYAQLFGVIGIRLQYTRLLTKV